VSDVRTLAKMVWLEIKLFAREPITLIFTLALPLLILMVLGGIFRGHPIHGGRYVGIRTMNYYLPGYVGLVLASIGTISLPVHLAGYRERGILRRFRASGMKESAMLASQTLVTIAIAIVGSLLLFALGAGAYSVHGPDSFGDFAVVFVISTFCFTSLGVLLASAMPTARAAQAVGLLIWFVMMFLSGTDGPLDLLPAGLLDVGKALPLYHVVIPMVDAWNGFGINVMQLTIVAVVGLVATVITLRVFRWE
jgi:ABC-2 type transport system permease protein